MLRYETGNLVLILNFRIIRSKIDALTRDKLSSRQFAVKCPPESGEARPSPTFRRSVAGEPPVDRERYGALSGRCTRDD